MRVTVRSEALLAAAAVLAVVADDVREDAGRVAGALATPGAAGIHHLGDVGLLGSWWRVQGEVLHAVGPGGLWGHALALDALAAALRGAAAAYAEVERGVGGLLAAVAAAADLGLRGGWFVDQRSPPDAGLGGVRVHPVSPTLAGPLAVSGGRAGTVPGVAELVAAGEGLGGGRVRVVETARPDGGSAWVVVVPGTQRWGPVAGDNPFDLTTDVRALTGEATVAAVGVAAALDGARAASGRATPGDPVLLLGHSQGGILAAALAADPAFRAGHRVTHLVTSGAPVALFPVPVGTRVLSVEHADDPVPRLDLTPNPAGTSWVSVVAPAAVGPVDVTRHRLEGYVATLRTVEQAPRGTVAGLDGWRASAGDFLGVRVRSVSEVVVERAGAGSAGLVGGDT